MQTKDEHLPKILGDKVLLVAASHTGNNIFCTPAIRFLKKHYPNTIFDLVALNQKSAEVFYGNSDINTLIITDKKHKLTKLSENYSTVICLYYKSIDVVSGIKRNLISASPLVSGVHHADQVLNFVADYTGYELTEADRAYVIGNGSTTNLSPIANISVGNNDILICMHLGCARTAIHGWKFFYRHKAMHQKLWPIDRYIELANQLIRANSRIRFVITGTKHESFLGKRFEKSVPGTINLIGKTSIPDLFKLMSDMNLFISQDCGVLHVASASSAPLLGLFGPTNPANTGPYPMKKNHIVIKKESMADINTTEVVAAALKLLETFPRTGTPESLGKDTELR